MNWLHTAFAVSLLMLNVALSALLTDVINGLFCTLMDKKLGVGLRRGYYFLQYNILHLS